MERHMRRVFSVWALLGFAVSGCGADGSGAPRSKPGGGPPPPIETHPPCIISADCPSGQHCDLGECVQDCNTADPCHQGASCSERARCVPPDQKDEDPPPLTSRIGTIEVEPRSVLLTDRDNSFKLRVSSESTQPIRYRVELSAPHLSVGSARGEFTSTTELEFKVNGSELYGKDVPGSIRIFTNLGSLMVNAPIKVGVTGTYQGSLSYEGAGIALGSSQLVVHVVENNGDVKVQVDPERSLLFPETDAGAVAGRGMFTISEGIQFSFKQLVPTSFGGTANHFARPIGRDLRFRLKPGARGTLQGTFEETIHGLFVRPVTLRGAAYFEHKPLDHTPDIKVTADPVMPAVSASSAPDVSAVFRGWTATRCYEGAKAIVLPCRDAVSCAAQFDELFYRPLALSMAGTLPPSSDPVGDIAKLCEQDLASTNPRIQPGCALIPPLACALSQIQQTQQSSQAAKQAFGHLYAHTLDPALVVSQDHMVRGLRESFLKGIQAHGIHLDAARQVLDAPAKWVLHPTLLEYLSRITDAVEPPIEANGEASHHTALRTLARLFFVLSTIDGESSRMAAADRVRPQSERVRQAQERGVLTLLETAVVLGLLESWSQSAPSGVGTEFLGVLTPMDQGFNSLIQGALRFGVPEGFIPYLFDPRVEKSTNFEQVLDSVQSKIAQQSADETAFTGSTREFEQNTDAVRRELEQVRLSMDHQIADACGSDFDLDSVTTDTDWQTCGANDGTIASLRLSAAQAHERLLAAENRIRGMRDKIVIEQSRLDQVKGVREGTIRFIDSTGKQLQTLVFAEGVLNAVEKMLELSSNSNLLNLGASAGMGAAAAVLEGQRTQIAAERQRLQTAQEVRIQADNARVEVINGMAVIKSMMIDMAQLQVEMRQELIGQLQAELDGKNAIESAKRLAKERKQVLARVKTSPFVDPSFRMLSTRSALQAIRSRGEAQRALYLAGRALEYHLNQPFSDALGHAVLNAHNAQEITRLENCLDSIFNDSRLALGTAQDYMTEFSVRERLGIKGPRTDEVTDEELSEGEQFRRLLLLNENLDGLGGVGIEFSSSLEPGNALWPSNVCDDKIATVEAQLVGDFLGDNQAQIQLELQGGGVLRRCEKNELINWSTESTATIQAGINSFGTAPTANGSLHGLSVASANWKVVIPDATASPSNADISLEKIEDVVLRVRHQARPIRASATQVSLACLATIGAGR